MSRVNRPTKDEYDLHPRRDKRTIPIVGRDQELPLSWAQEQLWFLQQLFPESPEYNLLMAYRLLGNFDLSTFEASVAQLAQRHEILRTTFPSAFGRPRQEIYDSPAVEFSVTDVGALGSKEREAGLWRHLKEQAHRPFILDRGPLWRASILRLEPTEHVLVLTIHHIVADAWSLSIMMNELATLYSAAWRGLPSTLRDLHYQYADYAVWERSRRNRPQLQQQLDYWRSQLAGCASLDIPTDHPRPRVRAHRGRSQPLDLEPGLTQRLRLMARQEGVTLFMALLAAFQTLLFRVSGQSDVAVGSPISIRHHSDLERMVGLFVNTAVLRCDLADNPSMRTVLRRVREVTLSAYENVDVPFEMVVRELRPTRELSRSPLFQAMFQLDTTPPSRPQFADLQAIRLHVPRIAARFDHGIWLSEATQGLTGYWDYSAELFEDATIERMTARLKRLIGTCVAAPDMKIGELPLLSSSELRRVLQVGTCCPGEEVRTIVELVEDQVKLSPNAIAVEDDDIRLTYGELNARANQLAHHMRKQGVGADVVVGICLERSATLIIAMLGTLKAGGAYLPLDPEHPPARLADIVEKTGAHLVLTEVAVAGKLPISNCAVICVDRDLAVISTEKANNPPIVTSTENLAYVMCTSGSTGTPKAVMVSIGAAANAIVQRNSRHRVVAEDRVLNTFSMAFDPSVWQFFGTLAAGATVVVIPLADIRSPLLLARIIRERDITVLDTVPTLLQTLNDFGQSGLGELRLTLCGGEPLTSELLTAWLARTRKPLEFIYGITETAIDVTAWQAQPVGPDDIVPIGKPVANKRVYLLDRFCRPVPVGVVGELYVGGFGLARGYCGEAALTAEKFIPDPFSQHPGARMYRTGDLARIGSDGNLLFVGRVDHQVKIRGYRVETAEVEAALRRYPGVAAVAVTSHITKDATRLIAYVVAEVGARLGARKLRRHLQQLVPEYMIPALFVDLDALPLGANGKIDQRRLPELTRSNRMIEVDERAPESDLEKLVAQIWADILGIARVGVTDDFFELGGHSLLATQVCAHINSRLGTDISPRDLFECPTVELVARRLRPVKPLSPNSR